jgi:hypothetical protein
MNKRTLQDVYDDERKNDYEIDEYEEEICCAKELLDKCCVNRDIFEKERKKLTINLTKQKKIEFIECDLMAWREYMENVSDAEVVYYEYYYDGSIHKQGYFKGQLMLEEEDKKHFNKFINDYFYYGYPNYIDRNSPDSELTECELAFEAGDAQVKTITYN